MLSNSNIIPNEPESRRSNHLEIFVWCEGLKKGEHLTLTPEKPQKQSIMEMGSLASSFAFHLVSCLFVKYQRYLCLNKCCLPLSASSPSGSEVTMPNWWHFPWQQTVMSEMRCQAIRFRRCASWEPEAPRMMMRRSSCCKRKRISVKTQVFHVGPQRSAAERGWQKMQPGKGKREPVFKTRFQSWWRQFAEGHIHTAGALPHSVALMLPRCPRSCGRETLLRPTVSHGEKRRSQNSLSSLAPQQHGSFHSFSAFKERATWHRDLLRPENCEYLVEKGTLRGC